MSRQTTRSPGQQRLEQIRTGVDYLTPLGRVCRWVPGHADREGWWLTFHYVGGTYRDGWFTMTPTTAQRLLQPVARGAER